MTIRPIFAWFDMWIGVFVDRPKRRVYIFPIPCFGIVIQLAQKAPDRCTCRDGYCLGLCPWSERRPAP